MALLYDRQWLLQSLPQIFDGTEHELRVQAVFTLDGLPKEVKQEFAEAVAKRRDDLGCNRADILLDVIHVSLQ